MAPLPFIKLAAVLFKEISKPLAAEIKRRAQGTFNCIKRGLSGWRWSFLQSRLNAVEIFPDGMPYRMQSMKNSNAIQSCWDARGRARRSGQKSGCGAIASRRWACDDCCWCLAGTLGISAGSLLSIAVIGASNIVG